MTDATESQPVATDGQTTAATPASKSAKAKTAKPKTATPKAKAAQPQEWDAEAVGGTPDRPATRFKAKGHADGVCLSVKTPKAADFTDVVLSRSDAKALAAWLKEAAEALGERP